MPRWPSLAEPQEERPCATKGCGALLPSTAAPQRRFCDPCRIAIREAQWRAQGARRLADARVAQALARAERAERAEAKDSRVRFHRLPAMALAAAALVAASGPATPADARTLPGSGLSKGLGAAVGGGLDGYPGGYASDPHETYGDHFPKDEHYGGLYDKFFGGFFRFGRTDVERDVAKRRSSAIQSDATRRYNDGGANSFGSCGNCGRDEGGD